MMMVMMMMVMETVPSVLYRIDIYYIYVVL